MVKVSIWHLTITEVHENKQKPLYEKINLSNEVLGQIHRVERNKYDESLKLLNHTLDLEDQIPCPLGDEVVKIHVPE